jgi:alpha-amylase
MKRLLISIVLVTLLVGCAGLSVGKPTPTPMVEQPWWETAIFYEIFVRSFYDTNGDGIGDFNGITEKLDYLQELGVNAIWLMPIHPSPSYHGYDVINYFNVNPQYGTMDDFKKLLDAVHQRGMYLIIDLVINHTSSKNPWFVDSNSSPEAAYRNWYIWSVNDPGYSGPLGYPWHPGNSGYYYGVFSEAMPDLNYNNPEVSAEMMKIVDFWLSNVGVDGFRVDAVKYLIEEGQKQENTASSHAWLEKFYTGYKAIDPNGYTVGEVWGAGAFAAKTYQNELDEIFSFELAGGFVNSAQGESNTAMNSAVQFTLKDLPDGPLATFLTNHDQNRVMSVMAGNVDKAKVAAGLMYTSPGTVFIYYGEEIGMEGVKPDEDIRRPMQWNDTENAGFTTGTPWREVGENYAQANVAVETGDTDSLLNYYKTFIALRNQYSTLKTGGLELVSTGNTGVYAALRNDASGIFMVVVNLTKSSISDYALGLQGSAIPDATYNLHALYGAEAEGQLTVKEHSFTGYKPLSELSPYTVYLYSLEP